MVTAPPDRAVVLVAIIARLVPLEVHVFFRVGRAAVAASGLVRDLTPTNDFVDTAVGIPFHVLPD